MSKKTVSTVDNCLCLGNGADVKQAKEEMKSLFDCNDLGDFEEYLGCKIDHNVEERSLKMTQPILIQSFEDEFDLPDTKYESPAEPKKQLTPVIEGQENSRKDQTKYRSGVGKLLHMMRWTWNSVHETLRHMTVSNAAHMKAMKRIMVFIVNTIEQGWSLKPKRKWDGKDKSFKFFSEERVMQIMQVVTRLGKA